MEQPGKSAIAIAWYRPEEWVDLKRLCPDLHDTYQEWLTDAEATVERLGASMDAEIIKIELTVDELRRWRRATGREVDGKVRSQLAGKAAKRKHPTP